VVAQNAAQGGEGGVGLDADLGEAQLGVARDHLLDQFGEFGSGEHFVGAGGAVEHHKGAAGVGGLGVALGLGLPVRELPGGGGLALLVADGIGPVMAAGGEEEALDDALGLAQGAFVAAPGVAFEQAAQEPAVSRDLLLVNPALGRRGAEVSVLDETRGELVEDLVEPRGLAARDLGVHGEGENDASLPVAGPAVLVGREDLVGQVPVPLEPGIVHDGAVGEFAAEFDVCDLDGFHGFVLRFPLDTVCSPAFRRRAGTLLDTVCSPAFRRRAGTLHVENEKLPG
jgi:hypothetical protein